MENRQEYYQLLQNVRDNGDWESWIKFFLNGVAKVSNEATELARKIVDLRESHRDLIITKFGRAAANGLKVLEHLFSSPVINARTIAKIAGVSPPASYGLLNRFVEHKLLDEVTGRDGAEVDYVLSESAKCPRCIGTITEKTFVEW